LILRKRSHILSHAYFYFGSRLHFAAGFFGVQSYQSDYHQSIVIEAPGFNNTLAPYDTCSNSNNAIGDFGGVQEAKWIPIYLAGAVKRLQPLINGVNLTAAEVFAMQQLCAYEVRFFYFDLLLYSMLVLDRCAWFLRFLRSIHRTGMERI
jgi:hypothetical protein